jgi:hypothetical protein
MEIKYNELSKLPAACLHPSKECGHVKIYLDQALTTAFQQVLGIRQRHPLPAGRTRKASDQESTSRFLLYYPHRLK